MSLAEDVAWEGLLEVRLTVMAVDGWWRWWSSCFGSWPVSIGGRRHPERPHRRRTGCRWRNVARPTGWLCVGLWSMLPLASDRATIAPGIATCGHRPPDIDGAVVSNQCCHNVVILNVSESRKYWQLVKRHLEMMINQFSGGNSSLGEK